MSFECPKSIRNNKKNNAWNIRRLVDKSFVPSNQQTSVLYCRLSYLYPHFVANIPGQFVFYISFPSSSFDPFMDRQRVPILRFKEARKINLIPFRGISNGHHGQ